MVCPAPAKPPESLLVAPSEPERVEPGTLAEMLPVITQNNAVCTATRDQLDTLIRWHRAVGATDGL